MAGYQRSAEGVMTLAEVEGFVDALHLIAVRDIGGEAWRRQRTQIEQLNMQAHHNARTAQQDNHVDEVVKEAFITSDKLGVLVHELLAIETWKDHVYPLLKQHLENLGDDLQMYLLTYHESTLTNLLEVLMFHESTASAAGEALLELVDYATRKLSWLVANPKEEAPAKEGKPSNADAQIRAIRWATGIHCISLVSYISQYASVLPLSVTRRLMQTSDMPALLVSLLAKEPWTRRVKKRTEKYQNAAWVAFDNRQQVCVPEAHVWMGLRNMLTDPACTQFLEVTDMRKDALCKARGFMHEILLDTIPQLSDLHRALDNLQVGGVTGGVAGSGKKTGLIIEQVPEMQAAMVAQDFKEIAEHQRKSIFVNDPSRRKRDIEEMARLYNLQNFDEVLEDPKCGKCGQPASKRCSKCKNEWYCSRECQIAVWKAHKPVCEVISGSLAAGKSSTSQSARITAA